jgi:hypothetical protein
VTTLRPAVEPIAPPPFDLHPAVLHPRIRPHCAKCGRWVPEASVRQVTHRDSLGPADDDWTGTCSVHGERVDVVWDEG